MSGHITRCSILVHYSGALLLLEAEKKNRREPPSGRREQDGGNQRREMIRAGRNTRAAYVTSRLGPGQKDSSKEMMPQLVALQGLIADRLIVSENVDPSLRRINCSLMKGLSSYPAPHCVNDGVRRGGAAARIGAWHSLSTAVDFRQG
jgi:hypothetical protein